MNLFYFYIWGYSKKHWKGANNLNYVTESINGIMEEFEAALMSKIFSMLVLQTITIVVSLQFLFISCE